MKSHADRKWSVEAGNINYYGNKLIYNCEIVQIRHTKVIIETSLILVKFSRKVIFIASSPVKQNIFS